ncbi:MAG TPA: tyrosine-type recombinase/integrase [Solirubrobacterales bacterium]|jgi:integrase
MAEGIRKRHTKDCPARSGGRCRCDGGYEASAYSPRDGKKVYKSFPREAEARSWRADAKRSLDRGSLRAPGSRTIREAGEAWLEGAERGEIRNRSGRPFKPSSLRGYRQAFTDRIVPAIGHVKVAALTTSDLQVLVDEWQAEGHAASTVRNSLRPLQAIYRRARAREGVPVNPTRDLELPVPERREVEIVTPNSAAILLAALPSADRAVWATALYAGLRSGELRALRWGAVDVSRGIIEVRESWDPKEGAIEPKTRRSRRRVPVPSVLRELLLDLQQRNETTTAGALVFEVGNGVPFQPEKLYRNADSTWHHAGIRERLRLHQARHTYASFMIAAGVNAKALSSFMGHSSITVTFDLYGHLMPGSEAEGAALLDAFLDGRSNDSENDDE